MAKFALMFMHLLFKRFLKSIAQYSAENESVAQFSHTDRITNMGAIFVDNRAIVDFRI
jgi:hypothetical protein